MPGPVMRDLTPQWLNDPSVTDSTLTQTLRALAKAIGANDRQAQVMGLATTHVPVKNPIRAYHGSPHDFDKFSMEKIGSGEGAQAYGHGLYFAENPQTAQAYRDALSPPTLAGAPMQGGIWNWKTDPAEKLARLHMSAASGNADEAIAANARMMARDNPTGELAAKYQEAERLLREWKAQGVKPSPTGRMYEVNIHADPESLLDWDKPLSAQPQLARDAILADPIAQRRIESASGEHTGRTLYGALGGNSGGTQHLKQVGIPGIKYLDQGSRTAGQGTRNYVIFDDSIIDILKKWGLLPAAVGTGSLLEQGQNR